MVLGVVLAAHALVLVVVVEQVGVDGECELAQLGRVHGDRHSSTSDGILNRQTGTT